MGAIMVPILPGKVDAWKQMAETLKSRSDEFADFNSRMGLTRHRAWLQQAPDGGHAAIALHEGPGADTFMQKLAESNHPFDVEFKGYMRDLHGMDFSAAPPPMPELHIDAGA